MLTYLSMKNFALIEELSFELFPGFNVLTGETGAGKSIVVGAISLLMGERASNEQIRSGCETAMIEAAFSIPDSQTALFHFLLQETGIEPSETVIISREITLSGRNICRVNTRMVPLSTLKEIGRFLIDLHGQHSHQSLLRSEQHLLLLDAFGGKQLLDEREKWQQFYEQRNGIKQKLTVFGDNPQERIRKRELLYYQRDEIDSALVSPEEEEHLKQKLSLLDNQEKLMSVINRVYLELYNGEGELMPIVDRINLIKEDLSALTEVAPEFNEFTNILEEASTGLTELSHELYRYQDRLTFSPEERQDTEERLETYRNLKRKYGPTVEDVLTFKEECQKEINKLENSESYAKTLEKELQTIETEMEHCADLLHDKRRAVAKDIEALVKKELNELGIANGTFHVSFQLREKPNRMGKDTAEFLFSANPGEMPKPLTKIISAGEMARVMLALKSILAEQDQIPTLIFDEIDSGIGGKTIQMVAEKLARLSTFHQVICVTHSPHIASLAHHQYYIYKEVNINRTVTRLKYLDLEMRIEEIARMLGGEDKSDITKRHAKKLLDKRLNESSPFIVNADDS